MRPLARWRSICTSLLVLVELPIGIGWSFAWPPVGVRSIVLRRQAITTAIFTRRE